MYAWLCVCVFYISAVCCACVCVCVEVCQCPQGAAVHILMCATCSGILCLCEQVNSIVSWLKQSSELLWVTGRRVGVRQSFFGVICGTADWEEWEKKWEGGSSLGLDSHQCRGPRGHWQFCVIKIVNCWLDGRGHCSSPVMGISHFLLADIIDYLSNNWQNMLLMKITVSCSCFKIFYFLWAISQNPGTLSSSKFTHISGADNSKGKFVWLLKNNNAHSVHKPSYFLGAGWHISLSGYFSTDQSIS